MAESNPTQVILTDDGIKIIKAQNTADNAASGITNLNDPNLMSVIEKQTQASQYAGLTSQYNVILKRAKEVGTNTTALTAAYTKLNTFMSTILTDTTKASDVDRNTYKSLINAYNTALSNVQTALSNNFNTDISNMKSSVSVASSAASSAVTVASQAAATGNSASQTASHAASVANQASADYTALSTGVKNGSVVHITTKTVIDKAVIGTAQIANAAITDEKVGHVSANKITAGTIDFNTITGKNINASNITTGTLGTNRLNVGKLSALSANLGDVTTGSLKGVDIVANTFSTPNGSFTTDSNGAITAKDMTLIGGTLTSPTINASTINGSIINGTTINTPNLNLGDNGRITGSYSVHDDIGWFQPINGTGSLKIANGYIQSTAHIVYYNKILKGIGGDKWGHWASSTQFVPAPNQDNPDIGNIAESTLTPAFLKLDILSDDKSAVNSRVYIDGTGLYINDGGGSQAISSMLSNYELVSSGMAYLNSGIQMKPEASFTFGNLAMTGYHTIAMLDGKALYFVDNVGGGSPIEIVAKTFTKSSRLSIKHDIMPLSTAESSRLINAIDVEKFRYTNDNATYKYQYGGVIDDVNSPYSKQYSMPSELLNEDGTGINLDSLTGILIKRVQDQDKTIGELSMRLTRLEMEK
ncbi:phage tail protein [Pediococcus pentosaceus]|uniref:phage tail protein n=1 Tax=Pediococcus pentosaceus TaxID=1255 RepID=UPI002073E52C|nr:phage tail protein [Pediococcus pentosaceus]MCM6820011.1 phage tail protein [Pediococcus pentosaceus]